MKLLDDAIEEQRKWSRGLRGARAAPNGVGRGKRGHVAAAALFSEQLQRKFRPDEQQGVRCDRPGLIGRQADD